MVPTVTNVNNVSLITGLYPDRHGITSNCYYDQASRAEIYMESPTFIRAETIFEKASRHQLRTVLLTVKEKLCTLLRKGAEVAVSAENPPPWIVKRVGTPPSIYSVEVDAWLFDALRVILSKTKPHLVYVATTDYVMHHHAPRDPESRRHISLIDKCIGELIELHPGSLFCVTADHGMSEKNRALDLRTVLKDTGIESHVVPTVKDRHLRHHSNLSGSAYLYLMDEQNQDDAYSILSGTNGVERVLTSDEAIDYHLPVKRIGDFFVLGEKEYVFGALNNGEESREVHIRSHGSLHERNIPVMAWGIRNTGIKIEENKDLAKVVMSWLRLI